MGPNSTALDAKVLMFGSKLGPDMIEPDPPRWVNVRTGNSIDQAVFDVIDAIIVEDEQALEDPLFEKNNKVPVIYFEAEPSGRDTERFINKHNLYATASFETLRDTLMAALEGREKIKLYLRETTNGEETLRNLDPPRYRKTLRIAERFANSQQPIITMLKENAGEYFKLHYREIVERMLDYSTVSSDEIRREKGQELAPLINHLLRYDDVLSRDEVNYLKTLGEGEVGEGPVRKMAESSTGKVTRSNEWVYKRFDARSGLSAKDIATQVEQDVKWLSFRSPKFKTAQTTRAFCFEDYPHSSREDALILMRDLQGQTLADVLETLNRSDKPTIKEKVSALRNRLVQAYIDNCVRWVNNPPPLTDKVQKPNPEELIEFYRAQISQVPADFNARTIVAFSSAEEALWGDVTKVFYRMSVSEADIVRNRDSGLRNAIVNIPKKECRADDYVRFFSEGDAISAARVDDSLINIDMAYRYGHVLEDLAHVVTSYDSRFLLYDPSKKLGNNSRFPPKKTKAYLLSMRDNFCRAIQRPDLNDADSTYVGMMLFRTLRKMKLFTDYWYRARQIDEEERLKDKLNRYIENIQHHYNLGYVLSQEMARLIGEPTSAVEKYRRMSLNQKSAKECLGMLKSTALTDDDKDILRTYAIKAFMAKIDLAFTKTLAVNESPLLKTYGNGTD